MKLLLDTHPFVWFLVEPKRVPPVLMALLTDPKQEVYVSAAAVWEATIKVALGKLSLPLDRLKAVIDEAGFEVLPVTVEHALDVRKLPSLHRDPFDRMLVAQAIAERMTLVTRDSFVRQYPVDTLWN